MSFKKCNSVKEMYSICIKILLHVKIVLYSAKKQKKNSFPV